MNKALEIVNKICKPNIAYREKKYCVSSIQKLLTIDQNNIQIMFDAEKFEMIFMTIKKN